MKTAAIYARVSTAEQAREGTSLDSQTVACRNFAAEEEFTVVKEVREDGSGAKLERPGLEDIRDMAARGEIEGLIVYDPDRLTRSLAHLMLLTEEFEKRHIALLFVNTPREDTPEGKMLFSMRGIFAEYERAKIMERSRRGKEARVKEGKILPGGNSPYGYKFLYGQNMMEIVEEEAIWVRRMFDWALTDRCSLRQIARRLDEAGVPTKSGLHHWHPETVKSILVNPMYAGRWHYGRRTSIAARVPKPGRQPAKDSRHVRPYEECISAPVPSIVSSEQVGAAIRQIERNAAKSGRNNVKHQYLLRSLLICGLCGYRMFGHTKDPNGKKKKRVYECAGRTRVRTNLPISQRCPCTGYNAEGIEGLEAIVWGEIVRQLSNPDLILSTLEGRNDDRLNERRRQDEELSKLHEASQALGREADKLIDWGLADIIDRPTMESRIFLVRKRQEALNKAKAEILERIQLREQASGNIEDIVELCKRAQEGLPHFTFEDKQEFLEALELRIEMYGQEIRLTGLLTPALLHIADRGRARQGRLGEKQSEPVVSVQPLQASFGSCSALIRSEN